MEHKTGHVLFFLLLLSSCLIDESLGKKHREADLEFLKARLNGDIDSDVDKSPFTVFSVSADDHHEARRKEDDRIYKLPGQPAVRFQQYGGYITIDASAGRAFYYYFVEAQNPQKAKHLPLLLWLNGGPGCSSLGYGAMEELGPFRVGSDGKTLFKNIFAWNNVANVIFLESPAGVGFSYSNTTSDFVKGGDRNTAADNYIFLLNWLERFPEYKGREFYIAGESYAGHYVPQLAHLIAHHNNPIINLRGILVGNGVINDETDTRGLFDYWASHALISPQIHTEIYKRCNFSADAKSSKQCSSSASKAYKILGEIDIYNIYYPQCLDDDDVVLTTIPKPYSIMNIDPCSDGYVHAYLNRPDVQEALHANVTKLKYDWQPCSDVLVKWTDGASTVLPNLRELMEKGIRVWLFSGDVDGRVPVTGTQYSIEAMEVPIQTPWSAWYLDGEVGGYVQSYKMNLTFTTIRGAGHQAPSYRPDRSLALVSHFITMKSLPSPKKKSH